MRRWAAFGLLFCVVGGSGAAWANHFDGDAGNGEFNPQMTVTVNNDHLVNRAGALTFDITQQDHEDPAVVSKLRTPGGWQFPFSTLRQGENSSHVPTTRCEDTIDGLDDQVRRDAHFARAEKIGTALVKIQADGITRPGDPAAYNGDMAFISWNSVSQSATLCLLIMTDDSRVNSIPDPTPTDTNDDIEGVIELVAEFPVNLTTAGGQPVWEAVSDLTGIAQDSTLQSLNVSLVELKAGFSQRSVGNWNPSAVDVAVNPGTSGAYAFEGEFTTCPPADPAYGQCASDKGTVTRTVPISIGLPAPALTGPVNNSVFTTSIVPVSGTSDPNATMAVFDGATDAGHITADGSGNWSGPIVFSDGSHTLVARTIDAGGQSAASLSRTILVDTTPPDAPVILTPLESALVGGTAVNVAGTSEPGSTVRLYEGPILRGTALAASGSWSTTVLLTKGPHALTAQATDDHGNLGPQSAPPRTFDVTTATPVIASPRQNRIVGKLDVAISGTSESGATNRIYEGGVEIASAVADATGKWTTTATLAETTHTITAISTAADGFVSQETAPRTFRIDTSIPPPPEITSPATDEVLSTNDVTITGIAVSDGTIVVYEGNTSIGSTTSDENGDWHLTTVLDRGAHTVHVVAADDRGPVTSALYTFFVDPAIPHITGPAAGGWQPGSITLAGTADENAGELRIFKGTTQIATTSIAPDGTWTAPLTFSSGVVSLYVRSVKDGVLGKASETRTYTIDAVAPKVSVLSPSDAIAVLLPGASISGTARDTGTQFQSGVARVEVTYTDMLGINDPLTVNATCSGCPGPIVSWSDRRTPEPGIYTVTVQSIDRAGNRSEAGSFILLVP